MAGTKSNKIWEPIDFTVYFSFIKWPVLAILVLEIAFRIWSGKFSAGLLFEQREIIIWLMRIAIFAFLGWRVIKNFGSSIAISAIAGSLAGFVVGLMIALYRFGDGFQVWKIFNLITETTLVIVVGALIAVLMVFILGFKNN